MSSEWLGGQSPPGGGIDAVLMRHGVSRQAVVGEIDVPDVNAAGAELPGLHVGLASASAGAPPELCVGI